MAYDLLKSASGDLLFGPTAGDLLKAIGIGCNSCSPPLDDIYEVMFTGCTGRHAAWNGIWIPLYWVSGCLWRGAGSGPCDYSAIRMRFFTGHRWVVDVGRVYALYCMAQYTSGGLCEGGPYCDCLPLIALNNRLMSGNTVSCSVPACRDAGMNMKDKATLYIREYTP